MFIKQGRPLFIYIYTLPWRYLFLLMPCVTIAYALFYRRYAQKHAVLFHLCCLALFLLWLITVGGYTVLHREVHTQNEFLPLFYSYQHLAENSEALRQNFMNILLFFPGGMFLLAVFPKKFRPLCFLCTVLLLMSGSIAIEYMQYTHAVGTPEMDDILHNTIGSILGAWAAWSSPWILEKILQHFISGDNHDCTA